MLMTLFITLALCACGKSEATSPQPTSQSNSPEAPRIACKVTILGDTTRISLLSKLAETVKGTLSTSENTSRATLTFAGRPMEFSTALVEDVRIKAHLLALADCAVLAMDATNGPLPVHREDVLLARQMRISKMVTVLTKTELVDDPELLDLEELEGRELLNKYKMDGELAPFLVDSPTATRGRKLKIPPRDLTSLGEVLLTIAPRSDLPPTRAATSAQAAFYVLTSQELFLRGVNQPPSAGTYDFIARTEKGAVTVKFNEPAAFGSNIDGTLGFTAPLNLFEGDRFVILRDGHLAVVGVITVINPK